MYIDAKDAESLVFYALQAWSQELTSSNDATRHIAGWHLEAALAEPDRVPLFELAAIIGGVPPSRIANLLLQQATDPTVKMKKHNRRGEPLI